MNQPFFVTLFDSGYAARGLAMLESLIAASPAVASGGVRVLVHALDDRAATAIHAWADGRSWLEVRDPQHLNELAPELPELRRRRSPAAFCWTLTPLVLRDALRHGAAQAVYVDADLLFHADPLPFLARLAGTTASVHITPHGFAPEADHSASVGRYCVQFLPVRNDPAGSAIIEKWSQQCLTDCPEAGGARPPGDQGYLDDWLRLHHAAVAEWDEAGIGCGPWNRTLHRLRRHGGFLEVSRRGGAWAPLLFVHHQDVKWANDGRVDLARLLSWPLDVNWLRLSSLPYLAAVAANARRWLPETQPRPSSRPPAGFWPRWLRDQFVRRSR